MGVMNLSLILTSLGSHLGVSPQDHNEIARRLVTLCDRYWNTAERQRVCSDRDRSIGAYYRFHDWIMEEVWQEVRQHRILHQKQSEERFQQVRQQTQQKLADIHRRAAIELRAAIERQLTANEKADRDVAIAIAERLLQELAADVQQAQAQRVLYLDSVARLKSVHDRVMSVQDVFRGGLTEELDKIRREMSNVGNLANTVEQELKSLYVELDAAEAEVNFAEQAAQDTCNSAQAVVTASTKEKAYESLQAAVRHVSSVRQATEKAKPNLFMARHRAIALKDHLQRRARHDLNEMASLRGLHRVLVQIDTALTTWNEYRQLEME